MELDIWCFTKTCYWSANVSQVSPIRTIIMEVMPLSAYHRLASKGWFTPIRVVVVRIQKPNTYRFVPRHVIRYNLLTTLRGWRLVHRSSCLSEGKMCLIQGNRNVSGAHQAPCGTGCCFPVGTVWIWSLVTALRICGVIPSIFHKLLWYGVELSTETNVPLSAANICLT